MVSLYLIILSYFHPYFRLLPFLSLNSGLRTVIAGITPFICPIMMFLMMPMMLKGMGRDASHDDKIRADKTVIGENKDQNIIK